MRHATDAVQFRMTSFDVCKITPDTFPAHQLMG